MTMREQTYLFIDDDMIAEQQGTERVFHPCSKRPDPVLQPYYPWEGRRIYIFGSVEKPEAGPLRMWYQALDRQPIDTKDHMTICYAESDDGVHFRRPEMDICSYEGASGKVYARTNIVLGNAVYPGNPYCASVIRDHDGSWRLTAWYEGWSDKISAFSGAKTFFSEDGLRFHPCQPDTPFVEEVRGGPNDVNCLSPDRLDGAYVSYQVMQRYLERGKQAYERDLITGRERVIALQTSQDFAQWSEPEVIIEPGADDPDFLQFYGLCGFRYGQYWLGLLWTYFVNDQTMGTELAVSRDGRTWKRAAPGHRLIPLGEPGTFDSGMLQTATAPVLIGGNLHIYYGGSDHYHDQDGGSAIGLATLPMDRWAGLKAGQKGTVRTGSFFLDGGARIAVNAYARSGRLKAGLLDESGKTVPGFSLKESDPIEEDVADRMLTWGGKADLSHLAGQKISLVWELEHAELYAFTLYRLDVPEGH